MTGLKNIQSKNCHATTVPKKNAVAKHGEKKNAATEKIDRKKKKTHGKKKGDKDTRRPPAFNLQHRPRTGRSQETTRAFGKC